MKLYTEEQLKSAFKIGLRENYIDEQYAENFASKGVKYLKPIELPSDEEIINEVHTVRFSSKEYMSGVIEGMQWMRDKIKGGNK